MEGIPRSPCPGNVGLRIPDLWDLLMVPYSASDGACSMGPLLVYGIMIYSVHIRTLDQGSILRAHGLDCRQSRS